MYRIVVSVKDKYTKIEVKTLSFEIEERPCRIQSRQQMWAEQTAIERAENWMIEEWVHPVYESAYGLSYKVFSDMCEDKVLRPLEGYVFEISECQHL